VAVTVRGCAEIRTCARLCSQYPRCLSGSSSPPRRNAVDDARLFLCARCQRQVRICALCDRGNRYCGRGCAGAARSESLRAAARRYQHSRRGRHCHAQRQRRYRARRWVGTKNVTHQGSAPSLGRAPLSREHPARDENPMSYLLPLAAAPHCHFCGRALSAFVRLGWRRR